MSLWTLTNINCYVLRWIVCRTNSFMEIFLNDCLPTKYSNQQLGSKDLCCSAKLAYHYYFPGKSDVKIFSCFWEMKNIPPYYCWYKHHFSRKHSLTSFSLTGHTFFPWLKFYILTMICFLFSFPSEILGILNTSTWH